MHCECPDGLPRDDESAEAAELERASVDEAQGLTDLRFRVAKERQQ